MSTAADIRDARVSMAASIHNFNSYCRKERDALTWTVQYDTGIYIERQYLDYGSVAVAQMLGKNYEEGYYKYRDLWCANIASAAKALSESIDEWGPPLTGLPVEVPQRCHNGICHFVVRDFEQTFRVSPNSYVASEYAHM